MVLTVVGEGGTRKGCREAIRIARDTVPVGLEGSDREDRRRGRGYTSAKDPGNGQLIVRLKSSLPTTLGSIQLHEST